MRHAAGELAHSLHPLGPTQALLGLHPIGDVPDRADDAVGHPGAVADGGQDRFPGAGPIRQVLQHIAREDGPVGGADPAVVGHHGVGHGGGQQIRDRPSANPVTLDVQRALEGWIEIGDHKPVVALDLQHHQIVRSVGEDGADQGVAGVQRLLGGLGLLERA